MLYPRYFGRFLGLTPFAKPENEHDELPERLWEVTIYQTADAPFEPRALMFDADTPLLFEWGETSPENVIEGSTATLKLISPDDRTFTDLYAIDPLSVVLEVKADGELFWRGSIEPELYEEPYSTRDNYVVELSFSDFGPMERNGFGRNGRVTFDEILNEALAVTALEDYSLKCATLIYDAPANSRSPVNMTGLCISSDNFYDEDGQPKTLYDAVETILRPFGLKMRQQGGHVWLYDWHSLTTEATTEARIIDWTSTNITLRQPSKTRNMEYWS